MEARSKRETSLCSGRCKNSFQIKRITVTSMFSLRRESELTVFRKKKHFCNFGRLAKKKKKKSSFILNHLVSCIKIR